MEPHPALIAIVDDDVSAREGISDLVSTVGFDVHAFASAEDFLLSPDLGRCVCLIVDMKLGAMSGLDLYDHLTAVGSSIPTIVITAFPDVRSACARWPPGSSVTCASRSSRRSCSTVCAAPSADLPARSSDCMTRLRIGNCRVRPACRVRAPGVPGVPHWAVSPTRIIVGRTETEHLICRREIIRIARIR